MTRPQFDFNIRVQGKSIFVYPLEEKQLVYLAQTLCLSKFSLAFDWFEVDERWVIDAHRHGWLFCR